MALIAADIYEAGVVAAVYHGPVGLVNLRLLDGTHLIAGREVAAFANAEDAAVGLTAVVQCLLESRLAGRGAETVKAPNFEACVAVVDRPVTGQNPACARGVGEAVVGFFSAAAATV